jgi:hypothetical protein
MIHSMPNHCLDPTASGLVAGRLRLSPAVDHARRSGRHCVMIRSMTSRAATAPKVLAPGRSRNTGSDDYRRPETRRREDAMAWSAFSGQVRFAATRGVEFPRPLP